jgi:hypothetical protein
LRRGCGLLEIRKNSIAGGHFKRCVIRTLHIEDLNGIQARLLEKDTVRATPSVLEPYWWPIDDLILGVIAVENNEAHRIVSVKAEVDNFTHHGLGDIQISAET